MSVEGHLSDLELVFVIGAITTSLATLCASVFFVVEYRLRKRLLKKVWAQAGGGKIDEAMSTLVSPLSMQPSLQVYERLLLEFEYNRGSLASHLAPRDTDWSQERKAILKQRVQQLLEMSDDRLAQDILAELPNARREQRGVFARAAQRLRRKFERLVIVRTIRSFDRFVSLLVRHS